jgi:hypothetical protein
MPTLNQCSLFESEQCKIDREKLRVKVEVNDIVKKMQKDLRLTLSMLELPPAKFQGKVLPFW